MNIKEKAKAYDEALEKAKNYHSPETACNVKIAMENLFSELKESEDEKIRKKVIDVLKLNVRGAESQMQASRGVDRTFEVYACNKVISWLEKQGEQKPAQNYVYLVYCRDENNDYFCGTIIASDKKECIELFRKNVGNYKFTATRLFKTSLPPGIPLLNRPFEKFTIPEGKYT